MPIPETANFDFRQPVWTDGHAEGLDYIRWNAKFLQLCAISDPPPNGYAVIPGWQTSVDISSSNDYETPDKWILTKGSMKIEIRFTWVNGVLDTIQTCYDNGVEGGLLCFDAVRQKRYITSAKHFGGTSPLSYYEVPDSPSPLVFHGLIDATSETNYWTKQTIVQMIYLPALPASDRHIFVTGSLDTRLEIGSNGSIHFRFEDKDGDNQTVFLEPTDSPGFTFPTGQWVPIILGINNDETTSPQTRYWKLWIDGTVWWDGTPEFDLVNQSLLAEMKPHSNAQPSPASKFGQKYGSEQIEFYAAHIWGDRTYLDPETNWDKFFELIGGSYKPKDLNSDGSGPTGSQPDVFAPDGNLSSHVGSAALWDEIGSVPDAPISPTD